MSTIDLKWREEIEYSLDHLPPLALLPDSLKESIADVPESGSLQVMELPMYAISGGNGKAPPVYQLLCDAEVSGRIRPGCTVIFASSGSAAQMLVYYMDAFAIAKVIIVVDKAKTPLGKIAQFMVPGGDDSRVKVEYPRENQTTLQRAKELEEQIPRSVFINQYSESGSVRGHKRTMDHIIRELARLGKKIDFLSVATGTCSTFLAGHNFLKRYFPDMHLVGVGCEGEQTPGARTLAAIERDVTFGWQEAAKPYGLVFCDIESAFSMSRKMITAHRKPIGPTGGLAYEGLLRRFRFLSERKDLKKPSNPDGTRLGVVIVMDNFSSYGPEYMKNVKIAA